MISIALISFFGFSYCKNSIKDDKTMAPEAGKTDLREKPKLVYDAHGNITERHAYSYRSDNSIRSKESYYYEFDDRNNLINESKESFDPEGQLVYKNINSYSYNVLNQKTEQKFLSFDKDNKLQSQARNTYSYNTKGELIEEKTYFDNGALKSIIATEHNNMGEIKSEEYIYFNLEGIKTDHKKYYYSKYGLERTENLLKK